MTFSYPTDDNENRVRGVIDRFIGVETADEIMEELIGVLSEVEDSTAGKYYTFFYNAKTPGTQYDEYPLVGVTDVFSWGFRGIIFIGVKIDNMTTIKSLVDSMSLSRRNVDVIELGFAKVRSK